MIKVLIATIMQNDNRGMHRKMQEHSLNKTKEKCVKDSIRKLKQTIENGNRENEGTSIYDSLAKALAICN